MTDTTKKPTAQEFDSARHALPAQHPAADALLAALDDCEQANSLGLIPNEYAHEVIRWAQRSGVRMHRQLIEDREARAAFKDLETQRDNMAWTIIAILAIALFAIGGATAYFFWIR